MRRVVFSNFLIILTLIGSTGSASAAGAEGRLFLRLVSHFESPSTRLVLQRSGIAESVLGRSATTTHDFNELAQILAQRRHTKAGQALKARLGENRATLDELDKLARRDAAAFSSRTTRDSIDRLARDRAFRTFPDEFAFNRNQSYMANRARLLQDPPSSIGIAVVEDAATVSKVARAEGQALASRLVEPLPTQKLQEELSFLAAQFKTTEAEILKRLADNRLNMREIVERAQGIRPTSATSSLRASVLDKIRFGIADRKLANAAFTRFVATMVATEIVMTMIAEYTARGDKFWDQLDYVAADLITFTLAEIVLTWVTHGRATSALTLRSAAPKPSTIFDRGFSTRARTQSLIRTGLLLGGTGFGLGLVGNGSVEILKAIRERDDPNAPDELERLERVVWNAFMVGAFMGISSNLRYQALSKISMILSERLATNRYVQGAVLTGLSYGNGFIGGTTYVLMADWATPTVQEGLKRLGYEVKLE